MWSKLKQTIAKQNSAYDDMEKREPANRFIIFITPILVSLNIDAILYLLGKETETFVFYFTLILMALWRLPYAMKR